LLLISARDDLYQQEMIWMNSTEKRCGGKEAEEKVNF
jgi:hypothetical protein